MDDDYDKIALICLPVDQTPRVPSVRDEYCMECAQEVWMSHRMKAHHDEHPDHLVLCSVCGVKSMDDHPDGDIEALPGDVIGGAVMEAIPSDVVRRVLRSLYGDQS